MNKYILIFILFISACYESIAQTPNNTIQHCGNEAYMQHLAATNPVLYQKILDFQQHLTAHQQSAANQRTTTLPDQVITIPVVVHVIHNNTSGTIGGSGNSNISDAQILSQITVLNKDYQRLNTDASSTPAAFKGIAANIKFSFCMASIDPNGASTTGITRTYSSKSGYGVSDDTELKALAYWPSDQYLNLWVCNLVGVPSTQTLLGYAQSPGGGLDGLSNDDGAAETDGVVINYKAFGTTGTLYSNFNLGRTATHEIGHWFGLLHPWGNYNSGDCSQSDYCDDTPICGDPYEAGYPTCPDTPPVSCSDTRMIQNYMEYSDDGCMNLFTADQKTRMRSSLELSPRRQAILSSLGCCTIPSLTNAPYMKDFEDGDILSGQWTTSSGKGFELTGTSAYGEGSYAIAVANDSLGSGSNYSYISPYLSLQQSTQPVLRFDWAYSPKTAGGTTDSVVVSLATGCADNWSPIQQFSGNSFSSTAQPRAFFSPHSNEWNTIAIPLNSYTAQAAIRIKFVSYSKGVNTFYLDNINVTSTSDQLKIKVYPNPTSDILHVESIFDNKKNIQCTVYNTLGQSLYQSTDNDMYSYIKQIDLSFLSSGLYFIQVSDGNEKIVKRIIKK